MPFDDDKKIIFLHIPKTGGSLVKKVFSIRQFDDSDPRVIPSPQHLTPEQLRREIGAGKFDSYYKFTFVRNPWARLVSDYFWRQNLPKKRKILPFPAFVQHAARVVELESYYDEEFGDHFIPQTRYTRGVDDVFRFERLAAGIRQVADRLGLRIGPIAKKPRKPHDEYWRYYDAKTAQILAATYAKDIGQFSYRFGAGTPDPPRPTQTSA